MIFKYRFTPKKSVTRRVVAAYPDGGKGIVFKCDNKAFFQLTGFFGSLKTIYHAFYRNQLLASNGLVLVSKMQRFEGLEMFGLSR